MDLEQIREQYRRQVESLEAEAAEWAAKAASEKDLRLKEAFEARVWQHRRSAQVARRRLAHLERRARHSQKATAAQRP